MRFLVFAPLLVACTATTPPPVAPPECPPPEEKRGLVSPPTIKATDESAKRALKLLFANDDVLLSVDPSCNNVGTEPADRTIGDYLSGFFGALGKNGANVVDAGCSPAQHGASVYACAVTLRRRAGEEIWSWGVTFAVRVSDGTVVRDSFRCTGAG